MQYVDFQGERLSKLGLGAMRLPVVDGKHGEVDVPATNEIVDAALEAGINYFDTAWGYHDGASERVIGASLARHERSTWNLATKFPSYNVGNFGKHEQIFEEQLEKCHVDHFDFYLLHNVNEANISRYLNEERYGTVGYFVKQKEAGRIRHLGFSTHGQWDVFHSFLERFGEHMEFCQLQLNYFDWTFQDAKRRFEYCTSNGLPVWAMEPLRGGRLCRLSDGELAKLDALRPSVSAREWAFRWLQTIGGGGVVLSGMGSVGQVLENARVFDEPAPLSEEEMEALQGVASDMASSIGVPCTSCHYCTAHCPMGLDVPFLLYLYNEQLSKEGDLSFIPPMYVGSLPAGKRPSACIACHACQKVCPQNIDVPAALEELAKAVEKKG